MTTERRTHRWRLALLALAAIAVFGACGNDDPAVEASGGGSFNEADVQFLQDMIPHHEEAIEMAEMVEDRTDRPELNTLAGNIIESQSAEIEEIGSLLEDAGESEGAGDHSMDMGGDDMGMSEDDMDALEASEGEEFDKMFSEMMIEHHTSAIEMANTVLDEGENPDVATLAEGIISEQEKEIADLESWLEEWAL